MLQLLVSGFLTVIIIFALPLTQDDLRYCFINDNETKGTNSHKGALEHIRLLPTEDNKNFFHK